MLFLQAVGKATADDLRHGGEVVGPLHGLDAEVTVFLLGGQTALEHHHAGHAQNALRVGNIVALDAPGQVGQVKGLHQLLHGQRGAHVLDLLALVMMIQRVLGVLLGQLHQLQLVAPLGHGQGDRPALAQPEPLLQLLHRLGKGLRQHVAGDQMLVVVILGQELAQDLGRFLAAAALHQDGAAFLHAAAPDMGQLHHGVLLVHGHGQHVLLHVLGLDGVLALHQSLDAVEFVPQLGGALVLHPLAGGDHFLLQLIHQLPAVAVQKGHHPL